jgi:hypothetical protein
MHGLGSYLNGSKAEKQGGGGKQSTQDQLSC